eukprot:SM000058S18575  [mRNA]  locus=s58:606749:609031:+ [translate_table: standard]
MGAANTALVYHNNTLYALHEGDKPYALRVLADGELETLGREDYDGQLADSFTAHPKLDPDTEKRAVSQSILGWTIAWPSERWEFRFNMKTGEAAQRQLGDFNTDFPRINDNFLGRTSKYAYASIFDDSLVKILGLVKFDLFKEPRLGAGPPVAGQGNVAGVFWHGPSRFGSEPVFVPASSDPNAPEDDGYLLNFVYDEANEYAPDHALPLSLGQAGRSLIVQSGNSV